MFFPPSSWCSVDGRELTNAFQLSVSGERVGEAAQQKENQRTEVMVSTLFYFT